ncbi:hypothetical protein B6N38_05920 [Cutibacterium avidum]|nr:Integrase catalytic region [Cutibacterium avidum 44067]MCO6671964.1 hypothetical protein [Cutibacterium avidum]PGX68370.1 hypothetical protein B6N39_07925 [Cutibacterium avidum]PGX70536.1 hypothetical protein B6N38_05920 [Cutibacterium avidum]
MPWRRDAHLINAALDLHAEDPGLGYRLITDDLPELGITAGGNRVHRLCKLQRIRSFHSVKNGSWKQPGPPVHDDLVRRQFRAEGPNQLWLTDITEHHTTWVLVIVATVLVRAPVKQPAARLGSGVSDVSRTLGKDQSLGNQVESHHVRI